MPEEVTFWCRDSKRLEGEESKERGVQKVKIGVQKVSEQPRGEAES